MKYRLLPLILICCLFVFVSGCHSSAPEQCILSIDVESRTRTKQLIFKDPVPGDLLYNGFGCNLTVVYVTPDEITLKSDGGLIYPNKDGTINLLSDSVTDIIIPSGGSVRLATQTTDASETITIRFQ